MPMKKDTKILITVILLILIFLSPIIAGWVMNLFTEYETYTAYYLTTRTDFSLGIKIIAVLLIIGINRKHD